jgi:hypothetical protein
MKSIYLSENIRIIAVAVAALMLLGGFFLGFSGSVDDAHITFWSAFTLAHEGKILNYNYDAVEQSSALLQTLLLALLHKLSGVPVVVAGHVSTIIAAILALWLTVIFARRNPVAPVIVPALLLATAPFFVYWSFGGMEGPLLAALLLLLLLQADVFLRDGQSPLTVALISLAVHMSRPEMPVVLCAFALTLCIAHLIRPMAAWKISRLLLLLVVQCGAALVLTAWRWWVFADIAPQPVSAKMGGDIAGSLRSGLHYLQLTLLDVRLLLPSVLSVAGFFLILIRWQHSLLVLSAWLVLVYGGFVLASGGDWMAAGRFWVPIMPLLMLFSSISLWGLCKSMPAPTLARYILLLAVLVGHVMYLWRGTSVDFNGVPLWKNTKLVEGDHAETYSFFERHAREHLHDIPTLAFVQPLLAQLLEDRHPVTIMAGQMGMVPYYLSQKFPHELHFYDRNGITERTLTHCAATQQLLRTRNGIGVGYEWILQNREILQSQCGFVMPDLIFDIETGWNKRNIAALEQAGYVLVYRQRGHVADEQEGEWLPLRRIYAGQFIAVSASIWEQLGRPEAFQRVF